MSRPLRERLVELNRDTEPVRLAPAAEVRARGRRRARRQLAGTAVGVTALVAVAGFGAVNVLGPGGTPGPAATRPAGSAPSCPFPVDLTLPSDPSEVVIRVIGERNGPVALDLKNRGYAADGRTGPDPDADSPGPVAVIRYGPQAIGAATLVRALVDGDAVMKFVPDRPDRVVDLALGENFRRLSTSTEINQKLVAAGEPTQPPTC